MKYKDIAISKLKKGVKEKEISKEIRKEYYAYKKGSKDAYKMFKLDRNVIKDIQVAKEKDFKETMRILNPARESIKTRVKKTIPSYYESHFITSKRDPLTKTIESYATIKRNKLTASQYKTLEIFKKEYAKKARSQINRFSRYDKALNLNKITTTYNGKKYSLNTLHDIYLKTSDRYEKGKLRKLINRGYEAIKSISPNVIRKIDRRVLSFDIDEYLDSDKLEDFFERNYSLETIDNNGNIIGWDIDFSQQVIISAEVIVKAEKNILWQQHEIELELNNIDVVRPENIMVITRLQEMYPDKYDEKDVL